MNKTTHTRSSLHSGKAGFTFFEILVVMMLISLLAVTAIPSFWVVKQRSYDAVSQADYANLKIVVNEESFANKTMSSYRLPRTIGPSNLLMPLNLARLSPGVRLNYARRQTLPATPSNAAREQISFELEHVDGQFRYRYNSLNGKVVEQKIRKH